MKYLLLFLLPLVAWADEPLFKNTPPPVMDGTYLILVTPSFSALPQARGSMAWYAAMPVTARDTKFADWTAAYWCYTTDIPKIIQAANRPNQNTADLVLELKKAQDKIKALEDKLSAIQKVISAP